MKNNKLNIILGFSLILFATIMYSVIPNFQTGDQNIIEDISLGSTTTSLIQDVEPEIDIQTPETVKKK